MPDDKGGKVFDVGHSYEVTGRSLLLFLMQRQAAQIDASAQQKA
jgi:hypothetical protein